MQAVKAFDDHLVSGAEQEGTVATRLNPVQGTAISRVIELHVAGAKFEIEACDKPYEVLMQVRRNLHAYGMSHAMADAMIEQLDDMFVHEAMDFTRKKKPTPLRIKMMVTDRAPDIDTNNKAVKVLVFDGMTKFGGAGGGIGMANTINGTTTTEFDSPDFEEIFTAGRKHVLVIHLEKDAASTLNGADAQVQAAAVVEAAGAAASPEALEELMEAIEAGEIEPEVIDLIETMAELSNLEAQAAEPDASPELQAQIDALKADIAGQMATIENVPPVLEQAAAVALEGFDADVITLGSLNNPVLEVVAADNDNIAVEAAPQDIPVQEMMELAADVALDLSAAEKQTMLYVVEAADIPDSLREKMVEAVQQGEFTVDDFKVVEARIENAENNPAVMEMAQKVEASAKEFAADVQSAIPPVALTQPLATVIGETIQTLPDMPAPQKAEILQAIKEGPLSVVAAAQVISAIAPVKPALSNAIERHQISQAVTLQAVKLGANISPAAQTNAYVASITKTLQGGNVPVRVDSNIAKMALPKPQQKALEVLNALQGKKIDVIAARRDIKSEINSVLNTLKSDTKTYSPLAKKAVEQFIQQNPNPSAKDVKKWIEAMPQGALRDSIIAAVTKNEKASPKEVAFTGDALSSGKAMAMMDEAMRGVKPQDKAFIESIRDKLVSGETVSREDFSKLVEAVPEKLRKEILSSDGVLEYKGKESIIKTICENCPHGGDCSKCKSVINNVASDHILTDDEIAQHAAKKEAANTVKYEANRTAPKYELKGGW